jgi:hypothetical protein
MTDATAALIENHGQLVEALQNIYDMTHDINDSHLRDYVRKEAARALGKKPVPESARR